MDISRRAVDASTRGGGGRGRNKDYILAINWRQVRVLLRRGAGGALQDSSFFQWRQVDILGRPGGGETGA